ncbi:hypothetical protein U1Q18_034972 [Sarracenia purpurea var. burkii]
MEMEVMMPSPAVDFNFDSACTSPFRSSPSSPRLVDDFIFFSAPTTPARTSSFSEFNSAGIETQNIFLNELGADCLNKKPKISEQKTVAGDGVSRGHHSSGGSDATKPTNSFPGDCDGNTSGNTNCTIPFSWEEKPGIPKTKDNSSDDKDFEFHFSGQLERTSLSADELFDCGKIKPLKPPPRLQFSGNGLIDSPKSPPSPISEKKSRGDLSPGLNTKDFDPVGESIGRRNEHEQQRERGRERTYNSSSSGHVRQKGTRSLSHFRLCDIFFESGRIHQQNSSSSSTPAKSKHISSSSSSSPWKGSRKWRLKDLLLFRSATEGRATRKDPLEKYVLLNKNSNQEVKNSSFRSTDSGGGSVSSRRRSPMSAHELLYTANRAVSEEMRKKTFLPYRHGLLGCLGFCPAIHDISRGLGSMTRG